MVKEVTMILKIGLRRFLSQFQALIGFQTPDDFMLVFYTPKYPLLLFLGYYYPLITLIYSLFSILSQKEY